MKHISIVVLGTLLAIAALWGGCYFGSVCPRWADFPTFFTTVVAMAAGLALVSIGIRGLVES
jgi:hypothetical protein